MRDRLSIEPGSATATSDLRRIVIASTVGTAIENFGSTIYAIAAALVIGEAFFPSSEPSAQRIEALMTLAVSYFAQSFGAVVFGHIGDRVGRKKALVASMLFTGLFTVLIGCVPTYASIGWWAVIILCVVRFGQGLSIGGEWGGAVLLAVENAPAEKRVRYGRLPLLGSLLGAASANLCFFGLSYGLPPDDFQAWGWRVPFLCSAVLVVIGLYVRTKVIETPAFEQALKSGTPDRIPLVNLLAKHGWKLVAGILAMVGIWNGIYIFTVYSLIYGTKVLHYSRTTFLLFQSGALLMGCLGALVAGLMGDRIGRRPIVIAGLVAVLLLGLLMEPMLAHGSWMMVLAYQCLGMLSVSGANAVMAAVLAAAYPTRVRYTGLSVTTSVAVVLVVAFTPHIAGWSLELGGLHVLGLYLALTSAIAAMAVLVISALTRRAATNQDGVMGNLGPA